MRQKTQTAADNNTDKVVDFAGAAVNDRLKKTAYKGGIKKITFFYFFMFAGCPGFL
jgi:hypothetical protein